MPEYRGRGVATALIEAAGVRARECGKPLGLLVDKANSRARRLYDSLGFKQVGERFFAGELMDHLQQKGSVIRCALTGKHVSGHGGKDASCKRHDNVGKSAYYLASG